jgi:hypothetical protein
MNVDAVVRINGLPLPKSLLDLIRQGRWRCPEDMSRINIVFPDHGDIKFYTLDYMPIGNRRWPTDDSPEFMGMPDKNRSPGDIDTKRSVLIADIGMGYDQPIALDYRDSSDDPPVLTLEWSPYGDNNRWVRIADNVSELAQLLGL